MHLEIPQEPPYTEIYSKMSPTKTADHTLSKSWAIWAIEMHDNMSQRPILTEIVRKNPAPQGRVHTCASLRGLHAHQRVTKTIFSQEFLGEMLAPTTATKTLCGCAVDMHVNISQETLYTIRKFKLKCCSQLEHPDQTPAFTLP